MIFGCAQPPEIQKAQIEQEAENSGAANVKIEITNDMEEQDNDSDKENNEELNQIEFKDATGTFEFEGYGPGKSHVGTFGTWNAQLGMQGDDIVQLNAVIDPSSVDTGIEKLDAHLRNDDFFNVEVYPEIKFEGFEIKDGIAKGELTFLGITKEVSFEVNQTEGKISSNFLLDSTPFGMKYTGVNKDVRIAFELE